MIEALVAHTDLDVGCYAVTWRGRGRLATACPAGVTTTSRPFPARLAHRLWARVPLPWAELLAGRADVVHSPNYVVPPTRRAAAVVTVHDLTFVHHPEFCTPPVLRFEGLVQRAIDRGAWVHTGAEAIAVEIRDHFDVDAHRVVAIHHGLDPALEGPEHDTDPGGTDAPVDGDADPDEQLVAGRYVLALGTIEPRKDHVTLIAAFDELADDHPDITLAVVGAEAWGAEAYRAALAQARHRDRIVTRGYVTDRARRWLLRNAAVMAFPSRYEGFGLPPLEAMQAGVPVVTTAAGALPEVVGDAAEIAPVGDAGALAAGIARALEPDRRAELIAAGRANVARFDWARTATELAALYRRAGDAR